MPSVDRKITALAPFDLRLFFLFLLLTLAVPAFADENTDAEAVLEIPFREDSGLTKAEYLLSAGKFSAAIDTATGVIARHPENADAYTYRGYALHRLGETAAARKNLETALKLNPTHLGANAYLADLYLEEGKLPQALEQLQVIRMTCGRMDCAEWRAVERHIDQFKRGGKEEK
jgi:Flp pilus assembly protein TadD